MFVIDLFLEEFLNDYPILSCTNLQFLDRRMLHYLLLLLLPQRQQITHCQVAVLYLPLFSSHPKTLHPVTSNVWTHAWSIKYRLKK